MIRVPALLALLLIGLALPEPLHAQGNAPAEVRTAFSLSSSEVFTSREAPSFYLTFQHLTRLDFRVYKVRDPFKFFISLQDPHQLGSDAPLVPQERSWIERIADWKAAERRRVRTFVRNQVSHEYRVARRALQDRQEIAQRMTLQVNTFAQVPLLNPEQVVTSWREVLPDHRDPELRRIPLEVKEPGAYLVEAVHDRLRAYTIVIVSDVGLVTKASPGQLLMFAGDRFSGEPRADCEVQVVANRAVIGNGRTLADGVVEITLPNERVEDVIGVARCGDQVAATDAGAWTLSAPTKELVGYVYTDKPIYRPGHTVHVKAILRWRERDVLQPFDAQEVELSVSDVNDKVLVRRGLTVDAFGAVHASFEVPATAALGLYGIRIASGDAQATGAFDVQEYRKPEFEVIVTPASRFVLQGEEAVATVEARYYFGQPVANARVRYVVNQQAYYSPFRLSDDFEGGESTYWYGGDQRQEGELRLDEHGHGEIRVRLQESESGRDYSARIEAQVTDASSREVSGNTVVHATFGPFMVAARTASSVFRPGGPVDVSLRTIDYTGVARSGVRLSLALERVTYPSGYYSEPTATPVGTTSVTTDGQGLASASFTLPSQAGTYRIRASADVDGRTISDETWAWVPGGQDTAGTGDQYLELLADRRTYQPGETARLMVRGASVSGPVFVTKEGQRVSWYRVLRPTASDAIEVPIAPDDVGDVHVNIAYLREGRLYRAERRVSVPAVDRTLQITLTADQAVSRPQQPGAFTVHVADAGGEPVQAQVSLSVVDEAVFAVKADDTPDPVRFFHRREYSRVGTMFSREYYFTGYSGAEALQLAGHRRRRPHTLADFKGDKPPQPEVRKDFPDAIYWIGDLVTDVQGRARVAVKYPDALTTWRLTARAVTRDTKAGGSVARTTTTKDLIVRVITPRFLTEGDEVIVPTLVHNYRDEARRASVEIAARGLDVMGDATSLKTDGSLASGAERRDDWRYAARTPGTAFVTAAARTESDSDAVELPVPVLPYGLRRDVGQSGSISSAGEQVAELTVPSTANAAGRLITVSLAPSLAGSLLGALDYLTSYPYGCTEQTLSSFLPNVLVTRTLTQLKLAPPERLSALDRQVSEGLGRLADYQHDDGGWGWWKTDQNHPFMTAYALFGLIEARGAGYKVDEWRISNGARALATMYAEYPRAEPDLKAYMAYVLARAVSQTEAITWYREGEQRQYRHDSARDELWAARERMSAYGRALLLLTLDGVNDGRGNDLATTLAGEAQSRGDLSWWSSDHDPLLFDSVDTSVEATSLAVQALARRDPQNPLLERAVRWLLLNRSGGYWGSTKQTAMAIYGLLDLLQARNETPQSVTVDVYVNDVLAGTQTLGEAAVTAPDPVTVSAPARQGANHIRIVTKGDGPVYWAASARYFDTVAASARSGTRELAITRRYSRLVPVRNGNRILYQEQPFTGTVAPGDVVSVRLTVAGSPDWRYLVIEDPLPAGVEAIQDTTAYPLERQPRDYWWWGSRVEYRDSRTVFFQESFVRGRYEFNYLVKVISAGRFRAIPAQIAPMYVPGVTASSEPLNVTVTAPTGDSR